METVRQRRYINYMAGRITQHCCRVNLSRALKARTSEFTPGRKKVVFLWTELPPSKVSTRAVLRVFMMFTHKLDRNHKLGLLAEIKLWFKKKCSAGLSVNIGDIHALCKQVHTVLIRPNTAR